MSEKYSWLSGKPLPYRLSESEISDFIRRNGLSPELTSYMRFKIPEYGIIFREAYGEFLVWYPPRGKMVVIDVTNQPIVNALENARYQTRTGAAVDQLMTDVKKTVNAASRFGPPILIGVGILLLWIAVKP